MQTKQIILEVGKAYKLRNGRVAVVTHIAQDGMRPVTIVNNLDGARWPRNVTLEGREDASGKSESPFDVVAAHGVLSAPVKADPKVAKDPFNSGTTEPLKK